MATSVCVSAYLSYALFYSGVGAHDTDANRQFSGECFRERATCEVARLSADKVFAFTNIPYEAECVPQPLGGKS